jgi:predicted small secreted protein
MTAARQKQASGRILERVIVLRGEAVAWIGRESKRKDSKGIPVGRWNLYCEGAYLRGKHVPSRGAGGFMVLEMKMRCGVVAAGLLGTLMLSGCNVESKKHGTGEDVKVATPFGGMQVKTDEATVSDGLGLPVYPGSTVLKKKSGKDDDAADVNMSFGAFKMRIKAMSYHSDDAPEKVALFYKPALAKYGDVIECQHNKAVGTPVKTSQGLTCDNNKSNHVTVTEAGTGELEYKTGSQQHQHIVALEKDGSGTKIGLVALDLPGHLSFGDDSDGDKQ